MNSENKISPSGNPAGKERYLGLDYGSKTVGVAVSDGLNLTAQGVCIIRREKPAKLRQTLARLAGLTEEYGITGIVLGYPRNYDGSEGERCEKTKLFKEMLEKRTGLPVFLVDERLTTVEAEEIMEETGVPRREFKTHVDKIAAMLILQDFLDGSGRP